MAAKPNQPVAWLRWVTLIALIGVALDVATYYIYLAIPGNYYPWLLVAPFIACLAWVGYTAHKRQLR